MDFYSGGTYVDPVTRMTLLLRSTPARVLDGLNPIFMERL